MYSTNRVVWIVLLAFILLSGCATTPLNQVRNEFLQGRPEAAIATLDRAEGKTSRDTLLIHMEKGLILHSLGEYQRSTDEFLNAARIMDMQDYVSISEQTKTLVINEWAGAYKGEYSERLWIHTYQMMNYLLLGQYQSAAVEARQALKVIDRYPEPLNQDWFTQVLIAVSFESVGKINDALIEYKKLSEKLPDATPIARELYWSARQLGVAADMEKYLPLVPIAEQNSDSGNYGELILFIANGVIAQKVAGDIFFPPDIRFSFPHYNNIYSPLPVYYVRTTGEMLPFSKITTRLSSVAQASLDSRGKAIFAKEVARVSVKQNLAHNLRKNNQAAGDALSVMFFLLENADTRGWGTLPANLSLLRIPLKPGVVHNLVVKSNRTRGYVFSVRGLSVKAGQRIYRTLRENSW